MAKKLPLGCIITKKAIRCWKEFATYGGDKYYAPNRGTCWGKLKPGMVLRRKAARNGYSCAAGVHAHKHWSQFPNFGGDSLWLCKIPKGTFVHVCDWKYRADAVKLIKEVTKNG